MLMCKVAVTMPESRGWGEKKRKTLKIQLKSKEMKCTNVKCYFSFKQFNSYKLEMHKGGENLPRSASSYFFPPFRVPISKCFPALSPLTNSQNNQQHIKTSHMAITHLPRVAFINALENYPVKALWIGRRTRGMWINSSEIMGASEIEWVGAMSGWNISTRVCRVCVLRVCSLAVVVLYIYRWSLYI